MKEIKINLSEEDIINEFKNGKIIRKTCGIWNNPNETGEIVKSTNEIEQFYRWAYKVDVYEGCNGVDYDLVGASAGDML